MFDPKAIVLALAGGEAYGPRKSRAAPRKVALAAPPRLGDFDLQAGHPVSLCGGGVEGCVSGAVVSARHPALLLLPRGLHPKPLR